MNLKLTFVFNIFFLSNVYYIYSFSNIHKNHNYLKRELLSVYPSCLSENQIPPYHYLNPTTNELLTCEANCYKCTMLKTAQYTQCIVCDDNYYLYNYKCVAECPIETYTYSYKKEIENSESKEIKTINLCNEECEEGYSGYVIYDNIQKRTIKICLINESEIIKNSIEEKLNDFLTIQNDDDKINKINEQKLIIININEIKNDEEFKKINIEFVLLNNYINNAKTNLQEEEKVNIKQLLEEIYNYYYEKIEDYLSAKDEEGNSLTNNENNYIYIISSLSSLYLNKEILTQNCYNKFYNHIYTFSQTLSNFHLTISDIANINAMTYFYTKLINETLNKELLYVDPNFDEEEFKSNDFYRYTHEILLIEPRNKLMDITNNLIQFLNNLDTDIFLYKNDYFYFYKQKLSKESTNKQIIMSKIGLELYIIGSDTNIKTSSFYISNILDLIDGGEIENYKIILPSLNTLNNDVDWDNSFFNVIIFNDKYPLLNANNTDYVSPNFFEINFYDSKNNKININNLSGDNLIKIIKKKSQKELLLGTCVYYDSSKSNLHDEGIKSYDLYQYILCATSHLSTFTITSFSPTYLLSKAENNKEISEEETLRNSWWIQDNNMLNKLTSDNATIIYINIGIIFFCIILFLIKFLIQTEPTKAEQIIEDSYIRYTMNEDTESDKKILKYLIEKEIEFILKNRSDYEKQKRQELALNTKNDIFNNEQQVITIIEDGSDDDDEEDIIMDKRYKKVSFADISSDKKNKNNKNRINNNINKNINDKNKNEYNIELSNIKEVNNDYVEFEDNKEDEKESSKKYKYFNFKNNRRKTNMTSSVTSSNRRSTFGNFENLLNEKKAQNKKKVKKESINERFKKALKEQKARLIYSIMDKTISEFKGTGQNTLDIPTSMIKRPLSMIGISNALNKINNKDDEKILIKNEFLVILKLILFVLYQYEYRFISLFNRIILPMTRDNLIILIGFRLSIQLALSIIFTPRYFGDNYNFANNLLAMVLVLIFSDIIYSIIEIILMKKKIWTSTENKDKNLIKFKQIIECIIGYIIMIFIFFFGLYHAILISLYLEEQNIICNYIVNFISVFFIDYLIYENIIIIIKGFILTYAIYQDIEGCGLKFLAILDKVFIFYLAE